ncbi:MAG: hypothetical protein AAF609_24540 [Cyanobacteria bacterium P01_C01_bin.120]
MSQKNLPGSSVQSVSAQKLLAAAVENWQDTSTSARYVQAALAEDAALDVLISV